MSVLKLAVFFNVFCFATKDPSPLSSRKISNGDEICAVTIGNKQPVSYQRCVSWFEDILLFVILVKFGFWKDKINIAL